MIVFLYACIAHVCMFIIELCRDFTINLSRKCRKINCVAICGYYPVNWLAKIQIYKYIRCLI